jgi:hypothetical protein
MQAELNKRRESMECILCDGNVEVGEIHSAVGSDGQLTRHEMLADGGVKIHVLQPTAADHMGDRTKYQELANPFLREMQKAGVHALVILHEGDMHLQYAYSNTSAEMNILMVNAAAHVFNSSGPDPK